MEAKMGRALEGVRGGRVAEWWYVYFLWILCSCAFAATLRDQVVGEWPEWPNPLFEVADVSEQVPNR